MKLKLITLTALGALALGSTALANEPEAAGNDQAQGRRGFRHSPIERLTEKLNLTPEQRDKVKPIIDQAQPQLETIRREAMEKSKTVMDNAIAQIRPLLTPEQQKQLDEAKSDRGNFGKGRGGRRHRHDQDDSNDGDNP